MPSSADKLAESLSALKALQDKGKVAIRSSDMTRTHRERLLKNGFIKEVMKGWYISARPDETPGESTAWYASFWGFCAGYLNSRFKKEWCLNPEQSINLHIGDWTVPKQLLVRSPKGSNNNTALLHRTSVFDLKLEIPPSKEIKSKDGLQFMCLTQALIACPVNQYRSKPIEMRAALSMITEVSQILRKLLDGNHTTVAGRIAGAYRNIGRDDFADTIIETMKSAGHDVSETDPFEEHAAFHFSGHETSPYVNRMKMMWERFRQPIIENFQHTSSPVTDATKYLHKLDDIYVTDAYHSLSIEGYRVSEELIRRVAQGNWNPELSEEDKKHRDALAARGYYQAFQAVKESIRKTLEGESPGALSQQDHGKWYRELFGPSVTAGIIEAGDLAGYRNRHVYIRRSMHTPPRWEAVGELMATFFELLENEENPWVRVVLGHFIFVYIHPYVDGNGRMGRFLMNVMMAASGCPWLVIPVEKRDDYMAALESASVEQDIVPFAKFLANLMNSGEFREQFRMALP